MTGKPVGENARRALSFPCVTAPEYLLFPHVAIVRRTLLESFKTERQVLSKIVDEYREL